MSKRNAKRPATGIEKLDPVIVESVGLSMMTVYGENLPIEFGECMIVSRTPSSHKGYPVERVEVKVKASVHAWGRRHNLATTVPVYHENGGYRCAEEFFKATTNGDDLWIWSDAGLHPQDTTITCQVTKIDGGTPETRWHVGDGIEQEVTFRCRYHELPEWVQNIIQGDENGKKLAELSELTRTIVLTRQDELPA